MDLWRIKVVYMKGALMNKNGVCEVSKLSRVSDRDVTTQDLMMRENKVDLPPRRT